MDSPNSIDSLSSIVDNFGFSTYFCHLLKTKLGVDVTFIIETEDGEVEVYAHQFILAMRSTYYADLFYGKEKGSKLKQNQVVRLEKMNAKVFEDMIRFCYDCKPGVETLQEACTLFRIADQFKVTSLMNLCRTRLSEMEVNPGNVFDMLEASELMEDKKLTNACCKVLEENTASVMESYEKAKVTSSMVRVILGLSKLALNSEFELINWIMDCARAKVEEGVCKNAREYLKNFLPNMNFLALDSEKFAALCKDYPDIFPLEEIARIFLNIAHPGIKELPEWCRKEIKAREYTGQDLRSKLINNIMQEEQLVECVETIEKVWEPWKESVKCFLEKHENLKFQDRDTIERFLLVYICVSYCNLCQSVLMKILKIVEKDEKLMDWMIDAITFQKIMQCFKRTLILFEVGADPYAFCTEEEEEEENVHQDDVFERMKKEHANENRADEFKKLLQGAEEYQRMRKVLHDIEESGILGMLDDLYEINKNILESEKLDMRFMVIERIKKFHNDCIELMIELHNINWI